jgi:hypothetical protein
MKRAHSLPLIALVALLLTSTLVSSAAGSARAEALEAALKLNIEPAWAAYGEVQGVRMGVAVAGAAVVGEEMLERA